MGQFIVDDGSAGCSFIGRKKSPLVERAKFNFLVQTFHEAVNRLCGTAEYATPS